MALMCRFYKYSFLFLTSRCTIHDGTVPVGGIQCFPASNQFPEPDLQFAILSDLGKFALCSSGLAMCSNQAELEVLSSSLDLHLSSTSSDEDAGLPRDSIISIFTR